MCQVLTDPEDQLHDLPHLFSIVYAAETLGIISRLAHGGICYEQEVISMQHDFPYQYLNCKSLYQQD